MDRCAGHYRPARTACVQAPSVRSAHAHDCACERASQWLFLAICAGKRLPPLERQSRLDKLRKDIQVPGRGDSEPSHELVQFFTGVIKARCLQRIPWHRCASREAEAAVPHQGRGKQVLRLENGALEVSQQNHVKSVDVIVGLRLAACLHRRAGLISYGVARKWSEKLASALLRTVPKGFSPISIPQVLAADKDFWRMSRESSSPSPMDCCPWTPRTVMVRPEVLIHLTPQPGQASRPAADPPLAKWPRLSSYGASGKGKSKSDPVRMPNQPAELLGKGYPRQLQKASLFATTTI